MHPPPLNSSRSRTQPSWMIHLAALGGGLSFTVAVAAGLAYFAKPPEKPPEEEEEFEVAEIEIPEPPPPPPVATTQNPTPIPPLPVVFEEAPSTSSVRIAPTPISIAPLITDARPTMSLRFDFSPGQFRPGSGDWEPSVDHVFKKSEVDQPVVAIFKKAPSISPSLLRQVKNPRVRVFMVINSDGTVGTSRLMAGQHPEFDRLVNEAMLQWRFRPAMRKGKRVRQSVEMPVYVRPPAGDPFSVN